MPPIVSIHDRQVFKMMIPDCVIYSLCWISRNFQHFHGRWRIITFLESRRSTIKQFKAGPVSVGPNHHIWADPNDLDGLRYYINGINPREPISKLFLAILKPGDCVLDIGANVGYFTVLGSMLTGSTGTVHAFEASPATAGHLQITTQNTIGNIKIHPVAVSDHSGQIDFSCGPANHSGTSSIRSLGSQEEKRISVTCVKLDSYFADLAQVKLIKIDVEGAELMALHGMQQLLERTKPYVILELTDKFLRDLGSSAEALILFMKNAGYTAYPVTDLSQPLTSPGTEQIDVLFVPIGHRALLAK